MATDWVRMLTEQMEVVRENETNDAMRSTKLVPSELGWAVFLSTARMGYCCLYMWILVANIL